MNNPGTRFFQEYGCVLFRRQVVNKFALFLVCLDDWKMRIHRFVCRQSGLLLPFPQLSKGCFIDRIISHARFGVFQSCRFLTRLECPPLSSPGGQEFSSSCSSHQVLSIGDIGCDDFDFFKTDIDLRLEEAKIITGDQRHADNKESHQKTPSFILSLLQNALKTAKQRPGEGRPPISRKQFKEDDISPKGGFTDVGAARRGTRHGHWCGISWRYGT